MSSWIVGKEQHVRLVLRGNEDKIDFFHRTLGKLDKDYPFAPGRLECVCPTCAGTIYPAARFSPKHLLAFAEQVNNTMALPGLLKLKIKRYCSKETCEGQKASQKGKVQPIRPPWQGGNAA